jgi:hypothetical protein
MAMFERRQPLKTSGYRKAKSAEGTKKRQPLEAIRIRSNEQQSICLPSQDDLKYQSS